MAQFLTREITLGSEEYPHALQHITRPPSLVYTKGNTGVLNQPLLSIVGSRQMSDYGEQVLRLLVPGLVQAGLGIVSGLAYGIDGYAHRIALEQGGVCIAVMPAGLDTIYPRSNQQLFSAILAGGGCVLSEFPEGSSLQKSSFPLRNRIVAGLSQVTLIIEAGERSGTLITARCALEEGREVCVIPGDISRPQSKGVHHLLKQGACPVTCVEDILEFYALQTIVPVSARLPPVLTGSLATLYDLILQDGKTVDQLVTATRFAVQKVHSILSALELDGYIQLKGNQWQII